MQILNCRDDLIVHLALGNVVKYLFFWGHQQPKDGSIDKSCLSQWYDSGFEIDGVFYATAEHYMMAEKARLFGDVENMEKIINSGHPHQAKKLGRLVNGYDDKLWHKHRSEIVIRGNVAKFSQHEGLTQFLLNTKDRILVEASPRDRIWGIGMGKSNPDAANPSRWRGLNLLGFALIAVREHIRNS